MSSLALRLKLIGRGPVYTAQARALFAVMEADAPLPDYYKVIINQTIRRLISAGLWNKFAVLSIVSPVLGKFYNWNVPGTACTVVGSPTVTAIQGTQGNGSAAWGINTNIALSSSAIYTQNSATLGVFSATDNSTSGADCGTGTSTRFISRFSASISARINTSSSSGVFATPNSIGMCLATRNSSTVQVMAQGQDISSDVTVNSTGISSGSFTVGYAGTSYSARRLAAGFALQGINSAEILALNSILSEYMGGVGLVYDSNILLTDPTGAPSVTEPFFVFNNGTISAQGSMVGSSLGVQLKVTDFSTGTVVQVAGNDWNTVDASVSTGDWSGTLAAVPATPLGSPYKEEARLSDLSAQTSRTTGDFAVGFTAAFIGDSAQERSWRIVDTPAASSPYAFRFSGAQYPTSTVYGGWPNNGSAKVIGERAGPYGGDAAVVLGNQMVTATSKYIGMAQLAVGGTRLNEWTNGGTQYPPASGYNLWQYFVQSMSSDNVRARPGWGLSMLHWRFGVNDAAAGVTGAAFYDNLTQFISDYRTTSGNTNGPVCYTITGTTLYSLTTDASVNDIRLAQLQFYDANSGDNVFISGNGVPLPRDDDMGHWTTPGRITADAWSARAWQFILGLVPHGADGPHIDETAITATGNTIEAPCVLNGGTAVVDSAGNATATGLTGFIARVNGSSRTVTAATLASDVVSLTVDGAAFVPGNLVEIYYQYGRNPDVTNAVFDNDAVDGAVLFPGLPLQPTRGWATAVVT